MEIPTQYTQSDKDTIKSIERALEGFATEDNISRSAGEVFRTLGFNVVNDVSEVAVSPESLYRRVQNREASKRFKGFLEHDVAGSYYAGSLTTQGGKEYLATQPSTQQAGGTDGVGTQTGGAGTPAGGTGSSEDTDTAAGTPAGEGTGAQQDGTQAGAATGGSAGEEVHGGDTGAASQQDTADGAQDTHEDADGTDEDEEERDVHFFAVRLKEGVHLTRGETAELVRGFNRLMGSHPVVVAIWAHCALEGHRGKRRAHTYMTLGVCERSKYKQDWRVGSKLGKVRLMADVRCDKVHRGHMDILLQVAREVAPLHTASEMWQGLLRVFSVGLLTKRFYEELEGWYVAAAQAFRFPPDDRSDDQRTKDTPTAVIRLITRFIFVWFIKQKGLVNPALFDEGKLAGILKDFEAMSDTSGSYYNAIVQNLFFATLNQRREDRGWISSYTGKSEQYTVKTFWRCSDLFTKAYEGKGGKDSGKVKELFDQTPYVNGSLFECLDKLDLDEHNKIRSALLLDGFSNTQKRRAFLPNRLFFAPEDAIEVMAKDEKGAPRKIKVSGLLGLLSRYYFTVEENTPAEEQVALDPELLGRIFENLLGEYNSETAESARKDSGSFYTPREVVDYMCTQSLREYFVGACKGGVTDKGGVTAHVSEQKIDELLDIEPDAGSPAGNVGRRENGFLAESSTSEASPAKDNLELTDTEQGDKRGASAGGDDAPLTDEQCKSVIRAVYDCRVLDPACGSGAFLMGVLQRLVGVLGRVDPENKEWKDLITKKAQAEYTEALGKPALTEQEKKDRKAKIDATTALFDSQMTKRDYTRKLYVIQRCIHGVDIQPIAIQISKLRFFVSLICEQRVDWSDDKPKLDESGNKIPDTGNFGIVPLPNLETNLVAADTLVKADIRKIEEQLPKEVQKSLGVDEDDGVKTKRRELEQVRANYFNAKTREEKRKAKKEDDRLRGELEGLVKTIAQHPDEKAIEMYKADAENIRAKIAQLEAEGERWMADPQATLIADPTLLQPQQTDVNAVKRKALEKQLGDIEGKLQKELNKKEITGYAQAAHQIAQWSPYKVDKPALFFDGQWMFGVDTRGEEGFDVVIGNPPYIQLQKAGGRLGTLYEAQGYTTFARTGDIYCLFYERGLSLCRAGGVTCFITSNKWMRAGYGEATRGYLAGKNPKLLVDFGGLQVFESATVDTNILLVQNAPHTKDECTLCCTVRGTKSLKAFDLAGYVRDNASPQAFTTSEAWTILSPVEQGIRAKIEAAGVPLKDWEVSINYGIKTGFNDAFIITTDTREAILSHCKSKAERTRTEHLIRKVLRGRDIRRYGYQWAGLYLIATFPACHYDIDDYPAVREHLLSFGKERLEQTGATHKVGGVQVKARKKTGNKWFETQDQIGYWQDFDKPKIVYPNMTKFMPFYYDEEQYVTNQKCFILIGKHTAYLTAFFNSSIFKKCFRENFPQLQGGTRELSKIFFDKIPVKQVSDQVNDTFKEAVADIQREYTKAKAIAIDEILFDLYGLTDEERRAIGFVEIT